MERLDQRATARSLLDEIAADGHECDLTVADLLDYMAIYGLRFERGDVTEEYQAEVADLTREDVGMNPGV